MRFGFRHVTGLTLVVLFVAVVLFYLRRIRFTDRVSLGIAGLAKIPARYYLIIGHNVPTVQTRFQASSLR